jgi:hypothetical protein
LEYKGELNRINNVKKYVSMLTDQILKYKQVLKRVLKMLPKKKLMKVDLSELNLDPDDPLIEAADQLSEPKTPDISERYNEK